MAHQADRCIRGPPSPLISLRGSPGGADTRLGGLTRKKKRGATTATEAFRSDWIVLFIFLPLFSKSSPEEPEEEEEE